MQEVDKRLKNQMKSQDEVLIMKTQFLKVTVQGFAICMSQDVTSSKNWENQVTLLWCSLHNLGWNGCIGGFLFCCCSLSILELIQDRLKILCQFCITYSFACLVRQKRQIRFQYWKSKNRNIKATLKHDNITQSIKRRVQGQTLPLLL